MSAAAAVTTFQPWCIDYHKTMAAVAVAGSAIRRGTSLFTLATDLWRVQRKFRELLNELDLLTAAPDPEVSELAHRLTDLRASVNRVLDMAGKRGYTNRTLTAGSLVSLRGCNDRLLDFIERLELSRDPGFGQMLSRAMEEYERGETVSVDSVL